MMKENIPQKEESSKNRFLSWLKKNSTSLITVWGVAVIAYIAFFKECMHSEDKYEKEKILAVQSLLNDLNANPVYFKILLKRTNEDDNNDTVWIPNSFGFYETIEEKTSLLLFPSQFPGLLRPKNFRISFRPDEVEVDSIEINGEKVFLLQGKNTNDTVDIRDHENHWHNDLTCHTIYAMENDFFNSNLFKYIENPYIPDFIKEPLRNLNLIKYRPISLGKIIKSFDDLSIKKDSFQPIPNPTIIIASNNLERIADSLTTMTMVFEPFDENTGKVFDIQYIHSNNFLLVRRLGNFLYSKGGFK